MIENFADHPQTLGEIRSDKDDGNGAAWSPRDAVISLLRDIDSGAIDVDALVICIRERGKSVGCVSTFFKNATPDAHVALGLLESVKFKMMAE